MTAVVLAGLAGYGVFLVYTAAVLRWTGVGPGPRPQVNTLRSRVDIDQWLAQAGLEGVDRREFAAVVSALFLIGAVFAFALFGGLLPSVLAGLFAASFPVATYRHRRIERRARAQEAWPRLIEEIRVLTGSVGRSVPQALFEAGRHGPHEMASSFDAAHREWLLSTDFARTVRVLKSRLADPTADAVLETLLVAHELGGSDLDAKLTALAEDRMQDLQGRKDARARQAGARFARWFVLAVPIGMALAGMSIGEGRASYQSPSGQVFVAIAIGLVIGCWVWASRIMSLPDEGRVFE